MSEARLASSLLVSLLAVFMIAGCGAPRSAGAGATTATASAATAATTSFSAAAATGAPASAGSSSSLAAALPPTQLRARPDGLGTAQVGSSAAAFAASLGRSLRPAGAGEEQGCWYREIVGLDGVGLMVIDSIDGPVRRVDIDTPAIRTLSGVGVGSTRAQVLAAYPAASSQPHKYVPGATYLTVRPGAHVLLFETDASAEVTRYRLGEPDPVSWVEGCS